MSALIQILNTHAPDILRTLGLMEIQIAILALLVLAIEHVLQKPLPKIRYALWLVVLVKCLLPPFLPMPESTPATIVNFKLPAIFVGDAPITAAAPANLSLAAIILLLWLLAV
jgi:beta-lactamase regulating signal transducer with metallopeptidase domain